MTRTTLKLPFGLSASNIIGGGTSELALLIPHTQTVIKVSQGDPDKQERCEREAKVYERLYKSNIPRPLSLIRYNRRSECGNGMLLEYAENKTIRRYLSIPNNQPASAILISCWAQQGATALRLVHLNDVAHRDVSIFAFGLTISIIDIFVAYNQVDNTVSITYASHYSIRQTQTSVAVCIASKCQSSMSKLGVCESS
jgi:serine/threonine protein kinase